MTGTLPALTGSEKQIAWATDIRAASIAAWEDAAVDLDDIARDMEEDGDDYRAIAMRHMASLLVATVTHAGDWIDARQGAIASISTLHSAAWNRGLLPKRVVEIPEIAALEKIDIRQHGLLEALDHAASAHA